MANCKSKIANLLLDLSLQKAHNPRMFVDEAVITVRGGKGGDGSVSFRREKYIPLGGPDGGDGGDGGSVMCMADPNTDTLSDFASSKVFSAKNGNRGGGQRCNGHNGENRILLVPPGTVIYDFGAPAGPPDSGERSVFADLTKSGDRVCVARGGRGGYGNTHFKSSVRQAPDFAEIGEPGEERKLRFELKLVADIGIIGFPNVGKSTLISVISAAKPKIADYPFTTLVPNLGVVTVGGRPAGHSLGGGRSFVVCDIPGLIEGASGGKGLGHAFLKHIERCGALLHLLDASRGDAAHLTEEYRIIRRELETYSPLLAKKPEIVMLSKIDLLGNDGRTLMRALRALDVPVKGCISAVTQKGTAQLVRTLLTAALQNRQHATAKISDGRKPKVVLRPHLESSRMGSYTIEKKGDVIFVHGKRLEQFTRMTNFQNEGGVQRFMDVLERIGLLASITKLRTKNESVYIGDVRIDEVLSDQK